MDLCFLFYVCVDEETRRLFQPGPGALMANLDIESTYRQIPVHPDNRHLLGVRWMGVVDLIYRFICRTKYSSETDVWVVTSSDWM